MLRAGMSYLAAADPAALAAQTQADCLQALEQLDAVKTATRAWILGAFTAGQGYSADADYSATAWLIHRTKVTRGAARGHLGWARRVQAHPQVAAALAGGTVLTESMARIICGWTGQLPAGCRQAADGILIAAAGAGVGREDLAALAAAGEPGPDGEASQGGQQGPGGLEQLTAMSREAIRQAIIGKAADLLSGPGRAGQLPADPAAGRAAGRAQPAPGHRLRRDHPARHPQRGDPQRPALPVARRLPPARGGLPGPPRQAQSPRRPHQPHRLRPSVFVSSSGRDPPLGLDAGPEQRRHHHRLEPRPHQGAAQPRAPLPARSRRVNPGQRDLLFWHAYGAGSGAGANRPVAPARRGRKQRGAGPARRSRHRENSAA